jgi:hypothetical protein
MLELKKITIVSFGTMLKTTESFIPKEIALKDLLTFFLVVDFVVIALVGLYMIRVRRKGGTIEQLLEQIRDLLISQKPRECAEESTQKTEEKKESTDPLDAEIIHHDTEEEEQTVETELQLVKKTLQTFPKPLTKMSASIKEVLESNRNRTQPSKKNEKDTKPLPPPPPPPATQTQTESTKNNEQGD